MKRCVETLTGDNAVAVLVSNQSPSFVASVLPGYMSFSSGVIQRIDFELFSSGIT